MLAPLLIVLLVVAVSGGAGPASAGSICSGDSTVVVTVTDPDRDGVGEQSVDSAIPAGCDIGLRSDNRTGKFWSMRAYDYADSKLYFCHDGTDPPPGEAPCTSPQPDFPPDSDVTGSIVKENGIWRLYVHVNTRQQNLTLELRVDYAWKGAGEGGDDGDDGPPPSECPDPLPTNGSAVPQQCKYDLQAELSGPKRIGPREKDFVATLTVRNAAAAPHASPSAQAALFFNRYGFARISNADVQLIEPADIEAPCDRDVVARVRCIVPSLQPGEERVYRFQLPVTTEFVQTYGYVAPEGYPLCSPQQELECARNRTHYLSTSIDSPETRVVAPDLSGLKEAFFQGSSSPSDGLDAATARVAATGPRIRKVEIAVLRRTGKAKAAAARCFWLTGERGAFKARKPGKGRRCLGPIWLKASGTRRWEWRGNEPLPNGRYVVYARAIDEVGHTTGVFSGKRGNRRAFKIG